jgi:hypothetical protein
MFRRRPIACTWSVWDLTTYQNGPSRSRKDPLAWMWFEALPGIRFAELTPIEVKHN